MPQPVRILIVDDVSPSRDGLQALLASHPEIEVIGQAWNGLEAVKKVEDCHPEVVLMDVKMPVLDGLQATRLIKNGWPAVRVILLSMFPIDPPVAKEFGADGFLVKGCSTDELLAAIQQPDVFAS